MKRRFNKHSGAKSELIACAWLLSEGYEVFRNVSQHGPVDIIAMKNGVTYFFDVKTATDPSSRTRLSSAKLVPEVKPLYVYPTGKCCIEWEPKIKGDFGSKNCQKCGKEFRVRVSWQINCRNCKEF